MTPVLSPCRGTLTPDAAKQGEPRVAQRRVFRNDEVLPEFDARAASGEDRRAVIQIMHAADVAAKDEACVVKQASAVGFFGRFQLVDQTGEEFALNEIAPCEASRRSPAL